jgi:hypothetical protein
VEEVRPCIIVLSLHVYMDQMLGTVPPSGPLSRMIDNVEANERV